jgi:hypothetical protein
MCEMASTNPAETSEMTTFPKPEHPTDFARSNALFPRDPTAIDLLQACRGEI